VFADRKQKNPAYSMRAFAKMIGLTQSAVSQILAGKKNLSPDTALKIAEHLQLSETEAEYFGLLVQLQTAKTPALKEALLKKLNSLNPQKPAQELSVDFFRMISDWYHIAIRNMTEIDGFEFNPATIAKRLGISTIEADAALERLLRLELLEPIENSKKRYRKSVDYVVSKSAIPNEALRSFHRQMMDKAIESLYTQTPKEKVIGSETFAFSEKNFSQAERLTEEYFQKMAALGKMPGKKTQVYHLGVQFFNLTKEKKS
jgi:uncharacterized protein (TIGR02147 family)